MTYRWFRWWTVLTTPLLLSPFVLMGVLVVEAVAESPERVIGAVPLVLLSLALAYASLAYLVNSTRITLEEDTVAVRHGPVPWKGKAYHLVECAEFFPGKITETRFTVDGVRIRFLDDSCEDLAYAADPDQAACWAQQLNLGLQQYHARFRDPPEAP